MQRIVVASLALGLTSAGAYAQTPKFANQGVTDEAGMNAIAVAEGHDAAAWGAAVKGWVERMGQNMAIGQSFRKYYDAAG